ncbi:MAG: hypothetical protein HYR87_03145 [Thaumarchaeota archaeon]|nr:hypothetical protein [Nitrososphaerota archaeon]
MYYVYMINSLNEIDQIFSNTQSILKLGVRFIALINNKGRIHEFVSKDGFTLSKEKLEMFLMGLSLQTNLQQDYDDELGSVKYSLIQREKTKILFIPVFLGTIVMVTDANVDHMKIMQKIMKTSDYEEIFSTMPTGKIQS